MAGGREEQVLEGTNGRLFRWPDGKPPEITTLLVDGTVDSLIATGIFRSLGFESVIERMKTNPNFPRQCPELRMVHPAQEDGGQESVEVARGLREIHTSFVSKLVEVQPVPEVH
jgi:hypothetical protein